MNYGEREPRVDCPYCGAKCYADWVDIGIGYQQCGPYHCEHCYASEIGPFDKERPLTEDEEKTGWYGQYTIAGSSANVDKSGKIIRHYEADTLYRESCGVAPRYDKNGNFIENKTVDATLCTFNGPTTHAYRHPDKWKEYSDKYNSSEPIQLQISREKI